MLKIVALVATCALAIGVPFALADEGQSTPQPQTATPSQPRCDRAVEHSALHRALARKHWREKRPLAGVELSCVTKRHIAKERARFRMYREYRRIAPYRCHGGSEGYYAIPCGAVSRESEFNCHARNPASTAYGYYQLLDTWWGYLGRHPTCMEQHHIAARLWNHGRGASNWALTL